MDDLDDDDNPWMYGVRVAHLKATIFVAALLVSDFAYFCLHFMASFFGVSFLIVNSICIVASLLMGFLMVQHVVSKHFPSHHGLVSCMDFAIILISIAFISAGIQISVAPQDVLGFITTIFYTSIGCLMTSLFVLFVLAAIFM